MIQWFKRRPDGKSWDWATVWAVMLFFAATSASAPAQSPAAPSVPTPADPVRAYFGPAAADDPNGIYLNFMKFLDSAKKSIHGSAHEVDMISIAEKLADKASRGVDVRLVVESRWWTSPKNRAAKQVLERSKVKVIPDNKESGLMHNKFFVVDGRRAWTGSTNITETCMLFNPNASVWIELPQVAKSFSTEFFEQEAGKFGKKESGKDNTPFETVTYRTGVVRVFIGPEDDPLKAMVEQIDRARRTIEVMAFVFSSQEAAEAMIRAHKRGVKVRVLLDNNFKPEAATARWKYVPARELAKAGVTVMYDKERAKLHHKCVIVDSRIVCVGSMNISLNGANENDENMVVIESPSIGKQFSEQFQKQWDWTLKLSQPSRDGDDDEETDGDDDGQK